MAADVTHTIRSALAAWSRGDVEQALASLDPDVEFETSGLFPGIDRVYHGHEGVRRFVADFNTTWQDLRIDVEHVLPGAGALVAVAGRFQATGRGGIPVDRVMAWVFTIRADTATRVQGFPSWAEAFDVAGVPPARRPAGRGTV